MTQNKHYDLELIDVSDSIENFSFTKVSAQDVKKIKEALSNDQPHFSFTSGEGYIFLLTKYFRGLMYAPHVEEKKTIMQENKESSVEVKKINIKKPTPSVIKKEVKNDSKD